MADYPCRPCFVRWIRTGMDRPVVAAARGWIAAGLVCAAVIGSSLPAIAQEEIEPQPAIMAPLAARALALDVAVADSALFAVGERGHILLSTDGGGTWTQAPSPTRSMLTGVCFANRDLGWAVGHDAAILRTTDGGISWELVHWAPENEEPLFDVWFPDPQHGIAIGAYGSYYVTSDGGKSWSFEPISEDDFHLHQIARADDGRLYIAAEAGVAYTSEDGGATWVELPSPYEGSFFGVLPLDGDSVLLFGLRGHLFRSDDAGQTWHELDTGTVAMLTDGIRLQDGTIVIVGLGGAVLVSTDGGSSFQFHQQVDRRGISAVVETAGGSLLMAGQFGVKTATLGDLTGSSD